MTSARSTWLIFAAGFLVFAGGTVWIESAARADALLRVGQHARNIAPALWNLDPRLVQDYMQLAADAEGYEELTVVTSNDAPFLSRHGPPLKGAEVWLNRLGLLPRVQLTAPIVLDGRVIGTIRAALISRTLYPELYLLVALLLVVLVAERSLRVIEGKRLLEHRVTERTRQLADSEARHRQLTRLLDLSPDVVFVREADGRITYWNEGATRVFGPAAAGELAARLAAWHDATFRGDRAATIARHSLWSGEVELSRPAGGGSRKFHASLSVTREAADGPERQLVIATDITVRKELESHLLRAQRAQAVGTLASGVAHDFNNLLTPILLSAQLLRQGPGAPAGSADILETIEQCARRGADLVRQLLNLSGNRPSHRSLLHPPDLLHDIAQLVRGTFPKAITFTTDWPDRLPRIEADPTNLHQAVLNLCVNARDAMPSGGRLVLGARPVRLDERQRAARPHNTAADWIAISVQDSGSGITPELRERIFEPFFTTKEPGHGTGLGLASVQGIAHNHDGFVEVDSTPGRGSTFTIYLPAQADATTASGRQEGAIPPSGRGELFLLVDDEPTVLETTARLLDLAGYRTLRARSGPEALELLARHRHEIRAVITDLMMPGMDGLSLRRRLREFDARLPVAVMTGLLNASNRAQIDASAFSATLAKPYHAHELLWCAARLIQSRQ